MTNYMFYLTNDLFCFPSLRCFPSPNRQCKPVGGAVGKSRIPTRDSHGADGESRIPPTDLIAQPNPDYGPNWRINENDDAATTGAA